METKRWTAFRLLANNAGDPLDEFVGLAAAATAAEGAMQTTLPAPEGWLLYYGADADPESTAATLRDLCAAAAPPGTTVSEPETIEAQPWHDAWRDYFVPTQASERIWIAPPWRQGEIPPGATEILIEPGMAFGTGTHATTQLSIRLLEQSVTPGTAVADIGSGSAILAIAAVKLGAARAVAVDNDLEVQENAAINIRLNGIPEEAITIASEVPHGFEAGLVVCNMLSREFLPLLPDLRALLAPGHPLLLSGFLTDEEAEIMARLRESAFEPGPCLRQDEWSAVAARAV